MWLFREENVCLIVPILYADREGNLKAARKLRMTPIMFNSRNVHYTGNLVNDFCELTNMIYLHTPICRFP